MTAFPTWPKTPPTVSDYELEASRFRSRMAECRRNNDSRGYHQAWVQMRRYDRVARLKAWALSANPIARQEAA